MLVYSVLIREAEILLKIGIYDISAKLLGVESRVINWGVNGLY